MIIKKTVLLAAAVFAAASLWGAPAKETGPDSKELLVYSVVNEDETKALTELFTKQTGIQVN
jgi:spermidine/putrescine-binding protein